MRAKERLYLTKDSKKLVGEGDPRGATLYAAPGDEIPQSAAEMFGLVDGGLKKPAEKPSAAASAPGAKPARKPKVAAKEKAPAEDKERKDGEDKGRQSGSPASTGTEGTAASGGAEG